MDKYQHIYSQERIQSFLSKYKDQVKNDYPNQIKCGIININELHIAADLLNQGELVAFPTETVYGLGANALNKDAILNIFHTKKRPLTDPLIVHVHDVKEIPTEKPDYLTDFADLFWPGPFTIILKSTQMQTTSILSAGTGSIGIRIPNNQIALQLLELARIPIAAPSANLFTHISPTSAIHVFNDFYDQKVHIIDAGRCNNGIESTVIKPMDNLLKILRLGSLAMKNLEEKLKTRENLKHFKVIYEKKYLETDDKDEELLEQEVPQLQRKNSSMEAPGQLLKHYSSNLTTYLLSIAEVKDSLHHLEIVENETVVIDFGQELQNKLKGMNFKYVSLSENYDAKEAMYNLYDVLRWAEIQQGIKLILLYDFEWNKCVQQIKNFEDIPTIQDKIFRSASGLRVVYDNKNFILI